jgi:hypothetical protein
VRVTDKCSERSVISPFPGLTVTTWNARATGTRVEFAVWNTGGHNFPPPRPTTPSAAQVTYAFITGTPVAPLPK